MEGELDLTKIIRCMDKNVAKHIKPRRSVIDDRNISDAVIDKLFYKVLESVKDPFNVKQKEIIELLIPMHLSNKTIARVINAVIPEAHATKGSVASQIILMNKTNDMLKDLLQELDKRD